MNISAPPRICASHTARIFILAGLAGFLFCGASFSSQVCLEVALDEKMPADLEWLNDIRWPLEDQILVNSPFIGLSSITVSADSIEASLLIAGGKGKSQVWMPYTLAAYGDSVVLASPFNVFGRGKISRPEIEELYAIATINDIDLFENRVLIFGAQRDDENRYAPDGAIAWIGDLGQDPSEMKPVFYSASGPGAHNAGVCGMFRISSARFMADGSFVIVPGFESDAYHYDPDGKLLGTWSSEAVGFDTGCGLSEKDMYRLSMDQPGRWAWVNQRRTVDEILPLFDGPGLLVRTVRGDVTSWELKLLRPGGKVETCQVPVEATSNLAHIRADARGNRIVALLLFRGYPRLSPHPPQHPRLLELRYKP